MPDSNLSLIEQLNRFEEYLNGSDELSVEEMQKPEIAFAIALKSKKVSRDWEKVQENLSMTLCSLLNNTDQNFRIIIAGHEKPNIEEINNERVTWISVKFPPTLNKRGFVNDKYRKRKAIGEYLMKQGYLGYFMPLDADDWIHYRFVEFIRSLPINDAFILNKGFMVNVFQKEAWIRDGFYRGCGSSSLIYFSNEKEKSIQNSFFKWRHHGKVPQYLRKINKSYTMIQYPLVTWVLAHGDNNSMILGKQDNRVAAKKYNAIGEKLDDWFYKYFKIGSIAKI